MQTPLCGGRKDESSPRHALPPLLAQRLEQSLQSRCSRKKFGVSLRHACASSKRRRFVVYSIGSLRFIHSMAVSFLTSS